LETLSNLHPYIVHFPIALFTTYFLIELLAIIFNKDFLSKSSHLILLLGVIGALAAVLTGNQAYIAFDDWENESLKIFNNHESFANITFWFFFFLLAGRTFLVLKKKFTFRYRIIFLVLSAIEVFFVLKTGYYGGELVNKFGINKEFRINKDTR